MSTYPIKRIMARAAALWWVEHYTGDPTAQESFGPDDIQRIDDFGSFLSDRVESLLNEGRLAVIAIDPLHDPSEILIQCATEAGIYCGRWSFGYLKEISMYVNQSVVQLSYGWSKEQPVVWRS